MLAFLKVRDFALIDALEVEFKEGLNVITGETGAGKSIIINALSSLINGKVSADSVRTGAKNAEIWGSFLNNGEESVLRRIIGASGRSRGLINDEPVTMARLEATGDRFISVYGQNEFQHLLDKETYIFILDNLLGLEPERKHLAERVELLKDTRGDLAAKRREAQGKERETSFLEFQIDEIERAALKEGEEEALREQLKVMKDAEKIRTVLDMITDGFYESDGSVQGMCKTFSSLLKPFSGTEAMAKLKEKIESVAFEVEEALAAVSSAERSLDYDPEALQVMEERLSLIYTLKSKYGKSLEEIETYKAKSMERLSYLSALSGEIAELERAEQLLREEVEEVAAALSNRRRHGAKRIEKEIVDELAFLCMEGLQFEIVITDKGSIDPEGKDDIEFMISTNPGEPLKPLRRIASGGELSRIMLAIKKVVGGEEEKTLIFDEVDAGIGGRVADMVGRRLKELATTHQIICITHLPQIAVYGTHHFLVEKKYESGATRTGIRELTPKERVMEIARMMGSDGVTIKSRERAEEMLEHA